MMKFKTIKIMKNEEYTVDLGEPARKGSWAVENDIVVYVAKTGPEVREFIDHDLFVPETLFIVSPQTRLEKMFNYIYYVYQPKKDRMMLVYSSGDCEFELCFSREGLLDIDIDVTNSDVYRDIRT